MSRVNEIMSELSTMYSHEQELRRELRLLVLDAYPIKLGDVVEYSEGWGGKAKVLPSTVVHIRTDGARVVSVNVALHNNDGSVGKRVRTHWQVTGHPLVKVRP